MLIVSMYMYSAGNLETSNIWNPAISRILFLGGGERNNLYSGHDLCRGGTWTTDAVSRSEIKWWDEQAINIMQAYVCMYNFVYMHVCMYVCMYIVCMYVCMNECKHACMHVCMYVW